MVQYGYYECPFGLMKIGVEDEKIVAIRRCGAIEELPSPTPLSDQAAAQLSEYFAGGRKTFDLPLAPKGTPFQTAVWNTLPHIPFGETRSYGQIAAAIGNHKATRAVGMACNRNPIWIVIPCHRVVGTNRNLTGYAGGLEMKQWLLQLEKA